ncbi:MAG: VWA domain-containing protein [Gammaproteobacteria bacterium]|nr:VWA domain-containing protein [Gammaproteobacteria bacterium]
MRKLLSIAAALLSCTALAQDYAIEAPVQAAIRQSLNIGWTAPPGETGVLEIRPATNGSRRVTYAYTRDNPQVIEAPEAPGSYVVVLFTDDQERARSAIDIVTVEAALSAPDNAGAGADVEISWQGPANRQDNLTWAIRDGEMIRGAAYVYVDTTAGTTSLRAPNEAGDYDIIYRTGSTIIGRAPVRIGAVTANLSAPATATGGSFVTVTFTGPGNSGDYIAFAPRGGEGSNAVGGYEYVGNARGNEVSLRITETPGDYDAIYVTGGTIIGRAPVSVIEANVTIEGPAQVAAGMEFGVQWSGNGNQGDVIRVVAGDGTYPAYTYIDPNSPAVRLGAPTTAGDYELVYMTRAGRVMDRHPLAIVQPPTPPGTLQVTQSGALLTDDDAVEIILDASGSMLQRIGGERRIEIAKSTLHHLVSDIIPAGTGFALRVFGHREADSCRTDLEVPLAPLDRAAATSAIANINAMNLARTPIADSIRQVQTDLANVRGQRMLVVLTDGEETCEGDPAAAIQALRELGWDVRVNIVGLAIEDATLAATFESWAAIGQGKYFAAADAAGLGKAFSRAVAMRFEVLDATGTVVATGLTGDEPLTLPPGNYRVVANGKVATATIVSDELSTVGL